ncbi:MAG: O-antigen ligase family protein, partial [bacterium]
YTINFVILSTIFIQVMLVIYQAIFLLNSKIYGTLYNSNFLSLYLLVGLIILVALLKYKDKNKLDYVFLSIGIILIYFAVILTKSRSGFIFLFFFTIYYLLQFKVNKWKKFFIVIVCLIPLVLFFKHIFAKFFIVSNLSDPFDYTRFKIWNNAISIIKDYWLVGTGLGTYQYISFGYIFPVEASISKFGYYASTAHNEFLQLGAETGIFSLIIVLGVLCFIFFKFKNLKDSYENFVAKFGLILIFLFSLTSNILYIPLFSILTIYFLSIVMQSIIMQSIIMQNYSVKTNIKNKSYLWKIILIIFLFGLITKPFLSYLYFSQGIKYEQKGKIEKAYNSYKNAAKINFGCAENYEELGDFCFDQYKITLQKKWVEKSLDNYNKAIKLNSLNPNYHTKLADLFFYLFQKTNEKKYLQYTFYAYKKAIKINPYNAFYYFHLANIDWLFNQNKISFVQNIQKSIELEPNFLDGYYYLGNFYEKENNDELSLKYYKKGLLKRKNIKSLPRNDFEEKLIYRKEQDFIEKINLLKLKKRK